MKKSLLPPRKHAIIIAFSCRCDGMADVTDSKSVPGDRVWVRVPPPAPYYHPGFDAKLGWFFLHIWTGVASEYAVVATIIPLATR